MFGQGVSHLYYSVQLATNLASNPDRYVADGHTLTSLAYCELYLMTAALALRVLPRAQLDDTTIEDVEYDHDLIVPQAKKGSVRVQVVIS